MTEPSHAVFLSYASQDQEAAQRICGALRAAGIEVWFDQSALRGGDVWDQTIRKQIKSCVLFIPVISRHTHERDEGYFRLEWKLAIDRSHLMRGNKTFLLPVVIDETREDDENVPERFKDIHWTRLPAGETPPAFVERVRGLASPEPLHATAATASPPSLVPTAISRARQQIPTSLRSHLVLLAIATVAIVGGLTYLTVDKLWISKRPAPPPATAPAGTAPAAFSPPPHSIAVLPFMNLSGDPKQDYFSDGVSEELINALAHIESLHVAARTSSFALKGKDLDIGTIARRLNVAAILEGSIRRSGDTVRVTAQLVDAVSGFHLWSENYDRRLTDLLVLQTDIAANVATHLRVTLAEGVRSRLELGGTRVPEAHEAYLHGMSLYYDPSQPYDARALPAVRKALEEFDRAIALDPEYPMAYVQRASVLLFFCDVDPGADRAALSAQAREAAKRAVAIAPGLGEAHLALAFTYHYGVFDLARAAQEYEQALALAPGSDFVQSNFAVFASALGHFTAAEAAARKAVSLNPQEPFRYGELGTVLWRARRYEEAVQAARDQRALSEKQAAAFFIQPLYALGRLDDLRQQCELADALADDDRNFCLALVYHAIGRPSDAQHALQKLESLDGDSAGYEYAQVLAQWRRPTEALRWLEKTERLGDPAIIGLKVDPLLDSLRNEPRFQAIQRELKFPD